MGQRIYLFIIGLGLATIGGFFMWLMARSYTQAKATRAWDETSAIILDVSIKERQIGPHVPTDYSPYILFGYEYGGERLTSERISPRGRKWAKEKAKAEAAIENYTAGTTISCWVNPEAPKTAILEHDTKAAGYSIWFPTLFFVGGIGVMFGAFKKR